MTDNTENSQKKVHLIKQPKMAQGEAPAAQAKPEEESPAEKKKVVVMKKKVVLKKAQAKVVAHHDLEDGEQPGEAMQAQPVQASSPPAEKLSTHALHTPAHAENPAASSEQAKSEAKVHEKTHPAEMPAIKPIRDEGSLQGEKHEQSPAPVSASGQTAEAAQPNANPIGQRDMPARQAPPARPAAPGDQAPAQPSSPQTGGYRGGYQSNPARPHGTAGTVGGYPANRSQGDAPRGQGYQGSSYQGRSGYQGGSSSGSGYQGGSSSGSGYQGRNYQGRTNPGGYQGNSGGGQGSQGGYQGSSGGYQGSSGGYQGSQGGYQGSGGGYQGGQGGYQGSSGGYQGGYRGNQPYDPNRPRPQSPGGYQGGQGGYQGSGGYQGGQSGYQGGQGSPSGYQGQRPYQGGGQGGYPSSRPPYPAGQGGYPPRGPRPQGPGGPGAPGGYRPGYPSQGGRPAGRAGNLSGGPRPGGYGARGPANGPSPLESSKTAQRKPAPRRKPGFVRREDVELEKELQLKKKAEARAIAIPKSIDIMENISVSDLAKKMNIKPAELIGKLMALGVMATINQKIDAETATILASEYNCEVKIVSLYDETVIEKEADNPDDLRPRPPIVTVMGHVDHGKTKLLDAIRKTDVVSHEYGGITQHIGAYQVETGRGKITFLDTPGHAAFTKMRARGAQVTDIVILVVSAVEGVMPQTKEALDHAKAAKVPIIVAINKIDLPEANPDRIKTQLSELGLIPEEWGGTTQFCEISALQKKGIPELLDAILLQAEILELQASYKRLAEAKIVESRIDQGRGIVATIIVATGTLHIGDSFVAGIFPGRVRAMFDDKGNRIDEATPSTPVEVLGFEGIPNAGDPFEVVEEEKYARAISDKRQELKKYEEGKNVKKVTLDNLYETISAGEVQELKVIIKGDVQGSVEALKGMLEKLSTKEVRLNVIRAAAGAISDDDVMMASASDAIIIGFNVRPIASAKLLADREKVDIRKYNIIYRAQEDIQKAMEGMLSPELKEQDIGKAEVRNIFRVPKVGIVAGCYMLEGAVHRNSQVRIIRDEIEIFQGKINSLRRFKDDAKEVVAGFECGIGIENCNDLKEGDMLEIFETVEIARSLGKAEGNGSDKT